VAANDDGLGQGWIANGKPMRIMFVFTEKKVVWVAYLAQPSLYCSDVGFDHPFPCILTNK
jgi:hypothetical protein